LEDLLHTKELSDCVIIVNTVKIYAHRCILCARSGFFKAAFASAFLESKSGEITIDKFDMKTFEMILSYIYTGRIPAIEGATHQEELETHFYDLFYEASDYFALTNADSLRKYLIVERVSMHNIVDTTKSIPFTTDSSSDYSDDSEDVYDNSDDSDDI